MNRLQIYNTIKQLSIVLFFWRRNVYENQYFNGYYRVNTTKK